jgi:hypothetical protein
MESDRPDIVSWQLSLSHGAEPLDQRDHFVERRHPRPEHDGVTDLKAHGRLGSEHSPHVGLGEDAGTDLPA